MEIVSPQCAFSDVFVTDTFVTGLSQWLHWNGFSPVFVLLYITRKIVHEKAYHKGCIEMVSPQYEFSGIFLVTSQCVSGPL